MDEFLEKNNVIPAYHHGSRKGHSTMTATITLQNFINRNQDKNWYTAVMLTDLSSAFDTCNHDLLTSKAEHIGIRGVSLEIMKSYLKDRNIL